MLKSFVLFVSFFAALASFADTAAIVHFNQAELAGRRQQYCRSTIDCPGSQFCRDRGDGVNVCMGSGGTGAGCRSSIDCAGSLFCRDRGDGINVCMGNGGQGAYCSTGIDCRGSLFCRDRGDGVNVCM